jgi:YidC/Oxa1 family membrane protein insertase
MIDLLWNTVIYDPLVNFLLFIYTALGGLPGALGFAIILFTLAIKLVTFPFSVKQMQSMRVQQEKQARIKPELDKLKKKYKDQPEEMQKAQMELYRREGMLNPFNAGCLLMLIPWPIFIGLYSSITSVMGDRPEQMADLAKHLYSFAPQFASAVPVNPDFFGLNLSIANSQNAIIGIVIVALVAGSTWLQSKMMPTASPAAADPQSAQMTQSMTLMMPMMIGLFSWQYPAGLSLYWLVFNAVGIVQQYFMNGAKGLFPTPATAMATTGSGKGKKNDGQK